MSHQHSVYMFLCEDKRVLLTPITRIWSLRLASVESEQNFIYKKGDNEPQNQRAQPVWV